MVASLQEMEKELRDVRAEISTLNKQLNIFKDLDKNNRVSSQVVRAYSGQGWQEISKNEIILDTYDLAMAYVSTAIDFDNQFLKLISHEHVDTLENAVSIAEAVRNVASETFLNRLRLIARELEKYKGLL